MITTLLFVTVITEAVVYETVNPDTLFPSRCACEASSRLFRSLYRSCEYTFFPKLHGPRLEPERVILLSDMTHLSSQDDLMVEMTSMYIVTQRQETSWWTRTFNPSSPTIDYGTPIPPTWGLYLSQSNDFPQLVEQIDHRALLGSVRETTDEMQQIIGRNNRAWFLSNDIYLHETLLQTAATQASDGRRLFIGVSVPDVVGYDYIAYYVQRGIRRRVSAFTPAGEGSVCKYLQFFGRSTNALMRIAETEEQEEPTVELHCFTWLLDIASKIMAFFSANVK